jgi:hypothetical protein
MQFCEYFLWQVDASYKEVLHGQNLWEGGSYSDFFTGRSYREVLLGCSYRVADKHSIYSTAVTYMKSIRRSYREAVTGKI